MPDRQDEADIRVVSPGKRRKTMFALKRHECLQRERVALRLDGVLDAKRRPLPMRSDSSPSHFTHPLQALPYARNTAFTTAALLSQTTRPVVKLFHPGNARCGIDR
jgi:hypothetical protein